MQKFFLKSSAFFLLQTIITCSSVLGAVNQSFDVIVAKKDTLQSIFKRYGLNQKDLYGMLSEVDSRKLEKIVPGQLIHFDLNKKKLQEMRIFRSSKDVIKVSLKSGKYHLTEKNEKNTGFYKKVRFSLNSSLYVDGKRAGLSFANIAEIDKVMGSDPAVDSKKLLRGTKFDVVLEGGSKDSTKKVIAVDIVSGKKHWGVTRFNNRYGNSFYHDDGSTAEVSFLKYPLKSFRISSHFSSSRLHPIHHYRRPHYGVDLAAPTGTPVWATAQGKVIFAGVKGGYGKTVILKHGSQYQTVYAHLSGYKKGLKVGDIVKQKQVIAYVGNTGHATGPHLHYEWRKKGVPYDPMRVRLPKKATLTGTMLKAFERYRSYVKKSI